MPLSYSNQDHTFMGDYIIPVLKQQTRLLLCLWRRIFHSDIQHCLNCSDAHSTQAFSCNNSLEGARGVMVIVVRNGHGDTSSNPGRDWLHFT